MSMTLPIEIHYDSTMLMHFCHFGFFPLTFVPIVQSTSLIIGHLSPCFTLSAILIVIGMGNPQVPLVVPIPIPVKTCTCTGTHEYGFLQVLTWVSGGSVGFTGVSRYSATCAMQWRGKVIWRSSCLDVKQAHQCTHWWVLHNIAVIGPTPCPVSPPISLLCVNKSCCCHVCMW